MEYTLLHLSNALPRATEFHGHLLQASGYSITEPVPERHGRKRIGIWASGDLRDFGQLRPKED